MIVILCTGGVGFPNGTAPTGRVTAYSEGLINAGEEVTVLLLETSEYGENPLNHQVKGNEDGVRYEYTCGTPIRGRSFLQRRWLTVKGIVISIVRLFQLNRNNHLEALLLYPDLPFTTLWIWLVSRILKIPLLLEKSEHPFLNKGDKILDKLYRFLYTRLVLWCFDGVIVVSNYLETYLGKILRPGVKIIKIPILVGKIFFENVKYPTTHESRNITYCGLLNENKDGVVTLMKAFREISKDYPDLILRLVGDSYKESKIPEYSKYAEEYGIREKVEFVGMVGRDQIPGYLQRATILALARPTSLQAQAGFPSKIGEYLASGKPVVVTQTGELSSYLEDGVNVYFSEPDNYQRFAARLKYVLEHPDEAQKVGVEGQKVAQEYFNYWMNMKRLAGFIESFSRT